MCDGGILQTQSSIPGGNRSSYCGGCLGHTKHRGGDENLQWGSKQWGMVWGCLRGASQCLIGGEQASRGGGKVGGNEEGNPLPKGQGGVVGVWRERPPAISWKFSKRKKESLAAYIHRFKRESDRCNFDNNAAMIWIFIKGLRNTHALATPVL